MEQSNVDEKLKHTSPIFQVLVKKYKAFLKENGSSEKDEKE